MTGRPKLLRLRKRTIVLSYNQKLTVKHRKFQSEIMGGLALLSLKSFVKGQIFYALGKYQ